MNQFPYGKCLAQLAVDHCGRKIPALLLTDKEDELEGAFESDTHHFLVVNLPRYLTEATPDAADAYLARRAEVYETRMARLDELASKPEILEQVLTLEQVVSWLSADPARAAALRDTLSAAPASPLDPDRLVDALRALGELDGEAIDAVTTFFGSHEDRDVRLRLIRAVTGDPDGRSVTGAVLAERTTDRIADARGAMAAYEELLSDSSVGETRMQEFIEQNLWLLGLDYAKMTSHQRLLSGTMDFVLERFDGFQDVLELKSPQDPIITIKGDSGVAAPPPSAFALSSELALALAQAHAYRDRLTRHAEATADLIGLELSRDPRLVIVIGRRDRLGEHQQRVLGELNKSLHRVEVVPYDVLLDRARALLGNVEKHLLATDDDPAHGYS